MNVHVTDPLSDDRWDELVARHPSASVFHGRGWLQALARTYGYEPLVLTSAPAGEPLSDGIVLCRVSSWLTGTRLVSLPFADHCEPLLNDLGESLDFMSWLRAECDRQPWKYVELRPLYPVQNPCNGLQPNRSYCFHELDLRPSLEQIFRGLHKESIQRKIRRAEKEGISYEAGISEQLVDDFYRLLLITRRRHKILPQPLTWFKNLRNCIGDGIEIRLARKNDTPIAAMLTLRHRSTVVYKYGCSNDKFHQLGGMPFLFWQLIQESKARGAERVDLGRSDLDNKGLIAFKDKLGATQRLMTYYRHPNTDSVINWHSRAIGQLFSILPDRVFCGTGRVLYRHMG